MGNLVMHLETGLESRHPPSRKVSLASTYQRETLNFETPGTFFGKLTERRWSIIDALQAGPDGVVWGNTKTAG